MNNKWTTTEQQVNSNWTASEQQLNTNNNEIMKQCNNEIKKVRKKNNTKSFDELIEAYTNNVDLQEELKNHLQTRKAKKASMTNRAIELSFKSLDKLSNNDEEKIKIVQQSIERGWIGFFALTKEKTNSSKSNTNWFAEIGKEEGIF